MEHGTVRYKEAVGIITPSRLVARGKVEVVEADMTSLMKVCKHQSALPSSLTVPFQNQHATTASKPCVGWLLCFDIL